jgi:hypothetical protein
MRGLGYGVSKDLAEYISRTKANPKLHNGPEDSLMAYWLYSGTISQ